MHVQKTNQTDFGMFYDVKNNNNEIRTTEEIKFTCRTSNQILLRRKLLRKIFIAAIDFQNGYTDLQLLLKR